MGGLLHVVGVLQDALLLQQTLRGLRQVAAGKLVGGMQLCAEAAAAPLAATVLFSSTAAVLGPPGQANYAAALLTASMRAKVFESMEIKTAGRVSDGSEFTSGWDLLVRRSVLESAAKQVIRIGPNTGWKLSAWAKLRYVLPNQI